MSCTREEGDFVSPIFTRPKKDGTHRMILNLKSLNKFITYYHFKMETVWSAIRSMTPGCYMASIDLKDAYYSVPIHADYHKYLKFQWQGQIYKFVCFPNGLAVCPRKFTKLLKPAFAYLRKHGQYNDCIENIVATLSLLDKLGFTVHQRSLYLFLHNELCFLGFVLDSLKMCVSLTPERAQKLIEACQKLLQNACPTIREVAQVLGMMTSSFPGVMFGPLHYRSLDMDKINALKQSKGNFEGKMSMSQESITEVKSGPFLTYKLGWQMPPPSPPLCPPTKSLFAPPQEKSLLNRDNIVSINFRASLDAQNAGKSGKDIFWLQISKNFPLSMHINLGHGYPL